MARRQQPLSDAEIEALLQQFVEGEMRMDEGEWVIQRFRSAKQRVLPHLLRMITDPDENTHAAAAELLMALEDRSVVRPLLDLLDDPTLSDWSKLSVFSVLQRFEVPVDLEALYRRLRDPEAVARRSEEHLLDSLTHATELAQFLEALMGNMLPEERAEMVYRLAETEDPRVLFPLRAALHAPEESVVLAAIEGLNELRAAVAVPWLEKLAQYGTTETIRQEAGKVAGHLTMRSSMPGADVIREMPTLADAQLPLHSCWLTTIDGAGGQIAFTARQRDDGYLVVADMMFTDHEGLKDCFGADMMAEEELQEMLDELTAEGITAIDITLERCREAVERAYGQTLAVGRRMPLEYFAWEGLLSGEDPRDIETWPVTEADIVAHPELLAHSIESLALEEMGSWFFNPDQIEPFARQHERLLFAGHASRARIVWMLRQGVESIVDSQLRALLADRLRRQAWLLAQVYTEPEVWQWAMAASAGLEETGVPSAQHPLLLGMIASSLDNLTGTGFLDELLTWTEDMWLEIVTEADLPLPLSERAKLAYFLKGTGLGMSRALASLLTADHPQPPLDDAERTRAILRTLNALETTFDEEIDDRFYEAGGVDWWKLRQELRFVPPPDMRSSTLQDIEQSLAEGMEREGCPQMMVDRARQLWEDYILITRGQIRPLRKPESWAAGVTYLVHKLYFEWQTQAEAGDLYGVSASTVGHRYHALRMALGVELFDYHFDKKWQAIEKLAGRDGMNAEELLEQLLSRFSDGFLPKGHED